MLKSEVHHQFWVTKKAVQRKLGSKEDEYIVSSDADLDSKIVLFKSISDTCLSLNKIIDQYQERLCILSQEECTFGRFLKEIGKRSKTTGSSITNSGKAIYYCGQQRMSLRVPLLRLQHEVDVFRCRAVGDTLSTMNCMEKERTEYRAALCWMKSISTQLDPDNGKGLGKFRQAQSHVRIAKENFDKLSMDCIQKIDLLTAARCNMFSHGLVAYMSAILQFSKKSSSTFKTVSASLIPNPRYDFCVLKDLSQNSNQQEPEIPKIQLEDSDQSMFFSDDFQDKKIELPQTTSTENSADNLLIEVAKSLDVLSDYSTNGQQIGLSKNQCDDRHIPMRPVDKNGLEPFRFILNSYTQKSKDQAISNDENTKHTVSRVHEKKPTPSWYDLFADLDPLENLQSFDLKLNEKSDTQQT